MAPLKQPNDYTRVLFRVTDGALEQALQDRAGQQGYDNISFVARRDLERYYTLLRRSLPRFTEEEALLLADVLNGIITTPESAPHLWAEVADAIKMDEVDKKWSVDGTAFVQRLRALTPFEQLAVADAVERAWASPDQRIDDMPERLRAVGLVRSPS